MPNQETPVQEVAELQGAVFNADLIAYVPSASWSCVPGVGTANLAYVPDFLISSPQYFAGNAVQVPANVFMVTKKPVGINASKQTLEGIGGLVAGQIAYQQLLEVQPALGNTTSE